MCGIFGIALRPGAGLPIDRTLATLGELFRLSESRGKEAAGLHAYLPRAGKAWTLKAARCASDFLDTDDYRLLAGDLLRPAFTITGATPTEPMALIAHSRLVTNGAAEFSRNNQPVCRGGVTMIHNGICVNVDDLWAGKTARMRTAEVDTEVLAALTADSLDAGASPFEAMEKLFSNLVGAASIAWTHDRSSWLVIGTNTGDLYRISNEAEGYFVFASERFILDEIAKSPLRSASNGSTHVEWLPPGTGELIFLDTVQSHRFSLDAVDRDAWPQVPPLANRPSERKELASGHAEGPLPVPRPVNESLLRYNEARMRELRRCSRCVLPETFPFISFDAEGVCNYCRSYRPRYRGLDAARAKADFIQSLQKYRGTKGEPDALVAFSGGRDSSYGLHLIKKEFGLTPITFTYDWGMLTDLARRNISRICGQLGVQNILVSADLRTKRDNIRKNVAAWLRKPDLGMVPLFMAGDKHFFRVVNQLKRRTGIRLDLWCANPLENTDFKSGFCNVSPDFDKSRVDYLSFGRKARLAAYYGSRFLTNPGYINSSLTDTVGAFFAYYVEPRRDFFFIFDYFPWHETEVNDTLLDTYDWELALDTKSTWRIGDGTAPFYNYIYVTARGFSEFDTFRSNQIREGQIGRNDALEAVIVENRPRVPSLRWYLDTINLDFDPTIRRINELDTLELHSSH